MLTNEERDAELSPKFNEMLNDREHFSSIHENIESPSYKKRSLIVNQEEWRVTKDRESAVFQPTNHFTVNEKPGLSRSGIAAQGAK